MTATAAPVSVEADPKVLADLATPGSALERALRRLADDERENPQAVVAQFNSAF